MKTITSIQKNILSKLTRVLMFVAIFCISFKADAQCSAGYTYTIDPSNNGNVSFTNTSTGSIVYYYWDFGDGYASNAVNPTHNYLATGTYTACLYVYDSLAVYDSILGCFTSYCTTFNVVNTITATCNASFIAADSAGYGYFTNTSTGTGLTSFWDYGDGTTGYGTTYSHPYPAPGTYYVCLTVTNFLGTCTDTYCDSVVIGPPPPCNAFFAPSDSATFTQFYDYSSGVGAMSYLWDFGDGTTSTTVGNETHSYATPGWYNICLTVNDPTSSCSDTYCTYTYSYGTGCNAIFYTVQDSSNLYNYFVYNYSTTLSGSMTYLWNFGDGTTSTAMYPTHTYATTTPVVLCLTISDGLCSDTYCDSITPGMMMSSAFTINVVPLGVAENITPIASLENYPNPFSNSTTINYAIRKDANVAISIVDLLGNTVAELENDNKTSGEYSTTWNAEGVAEGMYLLQLKVDNNIKTKKIIVSK